MKFTKLHKQLHPKLVLLSPAMYRASRPWWLMRWTTGQKSRVCHSCSIYHQIASWMCSFVLKEKHFDKVEIVQTNNYENKVLIIKVNTKISHQTKQNNWMKILYYIPCLSVSHSFCFLSKYVKQTGYVCVKISKNDVLYFLKFFKLAPCEIFFSFKLPWGREILLLSKPKGQWLLGGAGLIPPHYNL